MAVDHSGHRARMKERAMKEGLMNFQPHEFLEILLYPYIPYKDTNAIAHELLNEFGTLENVFEVGYEQLIRIKGMTKTACVYLSLMPDIFRRYKVSKLSKKEIMDTTEKLVKYLSPRLSTLTREATYMMTLDTKFALLGIKQIGSGVVNEAFMHTRDVVEEAILRNASNVVIAHNHPSGGNPKPSMSDVELTENIDNALSSIGVNLVDHIIISGDKYYSFNKHKGFALMYKDEEQNDAKEPRFYNNDGYKELFDLSDLDIDYGDGYKNTKK